MADKIPIRGGFNGGSLTGLAQFASGDTLGVAHGGTGVVTIGSNQLLTGNGTSAITSESNLTFDGSTLATTAFTATGNVSLDGGTFIFNESGADKDFRVEGDSEANLLMIDASTDRIGIGTATPSHLVDIEGVGHAATCFVSADLCATTKVVSPALCIGSQYALPAADGSAGQIMCTDGSGALAFATAAAGVTLAGSTNNTIATVTGANALAGEAELTFDGTDLAIGNTAPSTYMDSVHGLIIGDTSDATSEITIATTTSGVGGLNFTDTADTTNQASLQHFASSGDLRLNAQSSHSIQVGGTDAVYIDSSRRVGMGTSAPAVCSSLTLMKESAWQNSCRKGALLSLNQNGSVNDLKIEYCSHIFMEAPEDGTSLFIGADASADVVYFQSAEQAVSWGTRPIVFQPISGIVGIGTAAPDGKLHVFSASAGSVTAHDLANDLVIENNTHAGLTILTPDAAYGQILFASPSGDGSYGSTARIAAGYNSDNPRLDFSVGATDNRWTYWQGGQTDFCGPLNVVGSVSKGSGSFRIDHPLESKKDTHKLVHSFIEGPQADLIYSGVTQLSDGVATLNVDTEAGMTEGTFDALNRCVRVFTSNESNWDAVRGSITGNILTIESNVADSSASVSWMVIGERQDQHMLDTEWTDESGKVIVEPEKTEEG